MALLTDGVPNTTESLRLYEMDILGVVNVEMIDLNAKLRLALEEISFDVLGVLLDHASSTDPQGTARRMTGVSDVVVTPQLKRWHALHTLEIVYRDAYNNQLNDRYQGKWDEYQSLALDARDQTMRYGIGLVSTPVPRANVPTFSSTAGSNPSTVYYARVSWVSANGQEGEPSMTTTDQTPDSSLLVVQAPVAPPVASGWNVYLGLTDRSLTLQNTTPIPIGQFFTLGALVTGVSPGNGQLADTWVIGGRSLQRG